MRLVFINDDFPMRSIGAVVIHASPEGGLLIEFGPADGAPSVRLTLNRDEALELSDRMQAVVHGGGEAILLPEA